MKAELEHIVSETGKSLIAYRLAVDSFDFKWHFHPELELTYIIEGSGYRLVGDHSEPFSAGDLVLIGSNVPHTWVSDSASTCNSAFVIQFPESTALLDDFPEWKAISEMLLKANRGLSFQINLALEAKLHQLVNTEGVEQLTSLWSVLNTLSGQRAQTLASVGYLHSFNIKSASRLDKAFTFIHQHALGFLTLEQIANEMSMTPSSFSRFFRKMSGKTFISYVNEFRVREACHFLIKTDNPIPDVAFSTGFGSITHFNRTFLQITNQTPLAYRQRFSKP